MAFVVEIFFPELAFEISFFPHDDDAIYENKADRDRKQHPRRIDQDGEPKRAQSETDVHRIAGEAIKSVRDDARARIEGNGISAGAFLRNKSADGQSDSDEEDRRAKYPADRPLREAGRKKPFERQRCDDRQNE